MYGEGSLSVLADLDPLDLDPPLADMDHPHLNPLGDMDPPQSKSASGFGPPSADLDPSTKLSENIILNVLWEIDNTLSSSVN